MFYLLFCFLSSHRVLKDPSCVMTSSWQNWSSLLELQMTTQPHLPLAFLDALTLAFSYTGKFANSSDAWLLGLFRLSPCLKNLIGTRLSFRISRSLPTWKLEPFSTGYESEAKSIGLARFWQSRKLEIRNSLTVRLTTSSGSINSCFQIPPAAISCSCALPSRVRFLGSRTWLKAFPVSILKCSLPSLSLKLRQVSVHYFKTFVFDVGLRTPRNLLAMTSICPSSNICGRDTLIVHGHSAQFLTQWSSCPDCLPSKLVLCCCGFLSSVVFAWQVSPPSFQKSSLALLTLVMPAVDLLKSSSQCNRMLQMSLSLLKMRLLQLLLLISLPCLLPSALTSCPRLIVLGVVLISLGKMRWRISWKLPVRLVAKRLIRLVPPVAALRKSQSVKVPGARAFVNELGLLPLKEA